MSRASDRSALIRLASSMPVGSEERRALIRKAASLPKGNQERSFDRLGRLLKKHFRGLYPKFSVSATLDSAVIGFPPEAKDDLWHLLSANDYEPQWERDGRVRVLLTDHVF